MKNNILIFALFFYINFVVFGLIGYVKYKNKQVPVSEPVFVQPQVEIVQPPEEKKQVEPEKPLPREGVVIPSATTYELKEGKLIRSGKLKDQYFNVRVLKKVLYKQDSFYFIQIMQAGYEQDIWVVSEENIILLAIKREK